MTASATSKPWRRPHGCHPEGRGFRSRLPEQHDAVGIGAEAVVFDAPDVGGLGEAQS